MENISLGLAKKIKRLLSGEILPFSYVKSTIIEEMIREGVLQRRLQGRSRQYIFTGNHENLINYLSNNLGINDIQVYINNMENGSSRSENILASTDSKSSSIRTFKGFLVNCITPIKAEINGQGFILHPQPGTFVLVHDIETFKLPTGTRIIGVENSENFQLIKNQENLFGSDPTLFVSRYPQSRDLISWLQMNTNQYLHFGDFDFEGIRIFRDEYHKHLGDRASFFIPPNIELLMRKHGNKSLYNKQYKFQRHFNLGREIEELVDLLHKYKKCLEQEVLIDLKRY
jgi:hypothetical protein